MATESKHLPEELSSRVTAAISLLETSQSEISKASTSMGEGFTQAWLSYVLSGKRGVGNSALIASLADVLEAVADKRLQEEAIRPEQRESIRNLARDLKGEFPMRRIAVASSRSAFAHPGGAILPEARGFVSTRAVKMALEQVRRIPFTMSIEGPPNSGKSTILVALAHAAREEGIRTSFIDCKDALGLPAMEAGRASVEALLVKEILRAACQGWGVPVPRGDHLDLQALLSAILECTRSTYEPLLLILDDIASVGAEHTELLREMFGMIRFLHNARAVHDIDLSMAVSLTWTTYEQFMFIGSEISSPSVLHPRIEADWFIEEEVRQLLDSLGVNSASIECVLADYGGQPLLSHMAATRLAQGKKATEIFVEASEGRGQFAYHIRKISDIVASIRDSETLRVLEELTTSGNPTINFELSSHVYLLDTCLAKVVLSNGHESFAIPSRLYSTLIRSHIGRAGS